jgi:hypothetical protein
MRTIDNMVDGFLAMLPLLAAGLGPIDIQDSQVG